MAKWSLSYVLPVHNDEGRLGANVARLVEHLRERGFEGAEILLVENGSADRSWSVCEELAGTRDGVPVLAYREPSAGIGFAYARALAELETRHGPDRARWAVLTGSDLPWGFSDLESAKPLLDSGKAPVVIGSKAHPDSVAFRGRMRQGMSFGFRVLRRVIAGMRTGDSQGSIFLRLDVALPLARRIESRDFFYTTELVYYAEALPDGVVEVPAVIEASQLVRGATSVRAFSDSRAMLLQLIALRRRGRR